MCQIYKAVVKVIFIDVSQADTFSPSFVMRKEVSAFTPHNRVSAERGKHLAYMKIGRGTQGSWGTLSQKNGGSQAKLGGPGRKRTG